MIIGQQAPWVDHEHHFIARQACLLDDEPTAVTVVRSAQPVFTTSGTVAST